MPPAKPPRARRALTGVKYPNTRSANPSFRSHTGVTGREPGDLGHSRVARETSFRLTAAQQATPQNPASPVTVLLAQFALFGGVAGVSHPP